MSVNWAKFGELIYHMATLGIFVYLQPLECLKTLIVLHSFQLFYLTSQRESKYFKNEGAVVIFGGFYFVIGLPR